MIIIQKFYFSVLLYVQQSRRQSCDRWPLLWRNMAWEIFSIVQVMQPSPLWPCMCHMLVWGSAGAFNYALALAVQWCHELGYHRESKTSGSWPFVFMIKMFWAGSIPKVALIKNTADTIENKIKGSQVVTHNSQGQSY